MVKVTKLGRGSELGSKLRPSDSNPEWLRQEIGRTAPPDLLLCPGLSSDKGSPERKNLGQGRSARVWRTGNGAGWDFPCPRCREHQEPSREAGGVGEPGFQETSSHCARLRTGSE